VEGGVTSNRTFAGSFSRRRDFWIVSISHSSSSRPPFNTNFNYIEQNTNNETSLVTLQLLREGRKVQQVVYGREYMLR
jgi:hypothetical protein